MNITRRSIIGLFAGVVLTPATAIAGTQEGKFLTSNLYPTALIVAPTGKGKSVGFVRRGETLGAERLKLIPGILNATRKL
jgi:hypothetical protein